MATWTVEQVAARLGLQVLQCADRREWYGPNPSGGGATTDGFILYPDGKAWDRKAGVSYTQEQVAKMAGLAEDEYEPLVQWRNQHGVNGNGNGLRRGLAPELPKPPPAAAAEPAAATPATPQAKPPQAPAEPRYDTRSLVERGILRTTLAEFEVTQVTRTNKVAVGYRCWEYPTYHADGKIGRSRQKVCDPAVTGGQKYFWGPGARGGQPLGYGLDRLNGATEVWLVESEVSVWVMWQAGLVAVGTWGCGGGFGPLMRELKALGVKKVIICFDNDEPGRKGAIKAANAGRGAGMKLRGAVLRLRMGCDPADYAEAYKDPESFRKAILNQVDEPPPPEAIANSEERSTLSPLREAYQRGVPAIKVNNRQLSEKRDETIEALRDANQPPRLFHGDAGLVVVGEDKDGGIALRTATVDAILNLMADAAVWYSWGSRFGGKGKEPKAVLTAVNPPRELALNYLAQPSWPGVPPIEGVVTAPIVARDGTICCSPGYAPSSRLWLQLPAGFALPPGLLERPVEYDDLNGARQLILDHILGEVAFADDASRAHAVALMLCPFVRQMIAGPTPMHLVDAPTQASGKSYLAELCIAPFTEPRASTIKGDDEEWRKAILAGLLSGRSHLFYDNIRGKLSSPSLAAAITSPSGKITERAMGGLQEITATVRCVWVGTSNNAVLDSDAASRCVVIRLDTGMENPEARVYTSNPLQFIQVNRGSVVGALLTLVRWWIQQGRPGDTSGVQSRFPEWQQVVGGILHAAGISGFLGNLEAYRTVLDPENSAWGDFVERWWNLHKCSSRTIPELLAIAQEVPEMTQYLGDREGRSQTSRLGRALTTRRDRIISGCKIVVAPRTAHGVNYRLSPVSRDDSDGFKQENLFD